MNAHPHRRRVVLPILAATLLGLSGAAASAVSIHDIQYTLLPAGDSPYQNQIVTTGGVVAAVYSSGFVLSDGTGPWSGVWVYDPNHRPEPGDSLELTGTVDEYFGLTEIFTITAYQVLAHNAAVLTPVVVTASSIATGAATAESYEGVLVTCPDVDITAVSGIDGAWRIGDGTGEVLVGDLADYLYTPRLSDNLGHVTGVLLFSWSEFRIQPRFDEDIGRLDPAHFALRGAVVTPDQVLADAYVVVRGRHIEAVTTSAPAVPIIDTGGVICPALVDAHNHPAYNVFDTLEFGQLFANRYQWQSDPDYLALKTIYDGMLNQGLFLQMWKYAEARAITWGAGSIQGAFAGTDWEAFAHAKFLVRNPERFPGKVYSSIFPMNISASARTKLLNQIAGGVYRATVIHLSEGTDAASLNEFYTWQGWGMLDSTTVIIHGVPYGPAEFGLMAAAGASLVWSPRSNLELYGATADVPAAMAAGVPVSLGVDWCVSGSKGILQELSVADSLNQAAYGSLLTDQQLVEMVTANPARALGRENDLGRIAPGYLADFTVVSPGSGSAYRALIEATQHDVRLVMVEGRALYGVQTLMDTLNPGRELEPLYLCDGIQRRILFQLDDAGVPSSNETLAQTESLLLAAYTDLLLLAPCRTTGVRPGPVRTAPLFLDASPVPFSTATTILVSRPGNAGPGTAVRVEVYDVAGRQVRVLFEGSLPEGGRRFTWDGRDRRGERVASGVYFVQAVAGRDRTARSVVLLR